MSDFDCAACFHGARTRLIATTFLGTGFVLCAAGPALAQSSATPNSVSEPATVQEIVVTAQKRSEKMQDVPIAITAIDSGRLENSAASLSTTDLQQFVPGLVQGRSGTAGATFLRGIGTEAGTVGVESPVATYLDGIYLGVNALGVFDLNNIDQISVLKGPQGTLFGRNAAGGAIQITTKNPNLSQAEGTAEVGYGNYDTATYRLYGSVPLASGLAANVSALYKDRSEGTVYNVATGHRLEDDKTLTVQGKILWEPTSTDRVTLNGIYTHGEDLPGLDYFVEKGAVSQDGKTTYLGPHAINLFTDSSQSAIAKIGALTLWHDFGWSQLTNTVAHTDYQNAAFNDQAMTPGLPNPGNITPGNSDLDATVKETSEELQLQSADAAALKWIAGFFYFHDTTDTRLRAYTYPLGVRKPGFGLNTTMTTKSYAGYAQATYEVVQDTNLTAGLRYTADNKGFNGSNVFGGTVPPSVPRDVDFNKLTWRASLDHKFAPELMGYVSYNRGFRAGTYSALSLTNPPARPETLDAYEVGFKSDLLQRTVRLNVAGFLYDYSDLQLRQNVGSPISSIILNAAQARIYGLDADFEARVSQHVSIVGGLELLHSQYTKFPSGPANFPVGVAQLGLGPITTPPDGCTGVVRAGVGGHSNTVSCDLTGNEMINAPKFSASLGLEYTLPTPIGDFVTSVNDKYTGKSFATADNVQVLDAYHFVTASILWRSLSDRYFAKVWATNLNNSGRPAQLAFSLNTYEFLPNEPRFYGGTVGVKF